MFVTALAAGLLMFADTTPAAQPNPPAAQTAEAKPELKKVCAKVRSTDSNMPRMVCKMVPVKTAEVANAGDPAPKQASE
jgi:hypothetical protein